MKKTLISSLIFLAGAFAGAAGPSVTASDARIMLPLPGTAVTAGYGVFRNDSAQAVTLKLKAVKPFKAVELHETAMTDGKMGMRKIDQIVIEPGKTFELKPGGHHLMLFEPSRPLKAGEELTAEFDQGGKTLTLKFKVAARDVAPAAPEHEHHH